MPRLAFHLAKRVPWNAEGYHQRTRAAKTVDAAWRRRSCIRDLVRHQSREIMRIALAHALPLKIAAEGAAQEEQARHLGSLRCDRIQGYLVRTLR